jgi:hypothetical protein
MIIQINERKAIIYSLIVLITRYVRTIKNRDGKLACILKGLQVRYGENYY